MASSTVSDYTALESHASRGERRTLIHVDLDAFYCAVEEKRDPSLRGQAFAVGGRANERGVVASCSYAARARGVHSAMSMAAAQRLCAHLLVIEPRHDEYRAASRQVMDLLRAFTPLLEQLSIDEAFLDVSPNISEQVGGRALALQIQEKIERELGLSSSMGVASNKMVAKIATDCGKAAVETTHSPRAICVVPRGQEASFLSPLPVTALWGVGPKTAQRLQDLGISSIGALALWPERDLARRFGKHGFELSQHARGIDRREIVTERESKSISSETTFASDADDWEVLHAQLCQEARHVALQLQKQELQAATIKLKLRWSDFSIATRQTTLFSPTAAREVIEGAATLLLSQLWQGHRPVRLLGVGASGLSVARQLGLFDAPSEVSSATETSDSATQLAADEIKKDEVKTEDCEAQSREIKAPEASEKKHSISAPRDEEKQQHLQEAITHLEARFGARVVQAAAQMQEKT
ncbi:DNA polymerase-4 [Abditibacterium utsteinense]|uniref:DNA polymerase IV n=1 Tax=Abditibacterium utsteinense TaxID=1960156 RepID=A0A2S8SS03_9BACT|nr:DNA polymerase IV [Abditibacterium utsteinense]PQV63558.1 DNA polymerase-4 [Abditibacterium utsteinense]